MKYNEFIARLESLRELVQGDVEVVISIDDSGELFEGASCEIQNVGAPELIDAHIENASYWCWTSDGENDRQVIRIL